MPIQLHQLPQRFQKEALAQLAPPAPKEAPKEAVRSPNRVKIATGTEIVLKTQRKAVSRQRVARTRNLGTWTNAVYWQRVRWALRKTFQFWKPAMAGLKAAKVGKLYLCARCKKLFDRKGVQIDHTIPAGSLTCGEDLAGFLQRLTPESPDAFRVFCRGCHRTKTDEDRAAAERIALL